MDGGRREAEHGKVGHKESSDDEEGCRQDRSAGLDIRDMPEVPDAQRDEWLFKTEPLQGPGRDGKNMGDPRWYLIRWGLLTWRPRGGGGSVGRWNRAALRPRGCGPEQRILQEEEVSTPPRKEAHGHGGPSGA